MYKHLKEDLETAAYAVGSGVVGYCISHYLIGWSVITSVIVGVLTPFVLAAGLIALWIILVNLSVGSGN